MLFSPVRRAAAVVAALLIAVAGLAVGPAVAGASALVETTPVTTPDTTPDTTPVTTPVTTPDNGGGGGDDNDLDFVMVILLIGILVILIVAIVAALTANRNRQAATGGGQTADAQMDQQNIMGAAQWFHDQLAPQLMGSPPDQALQRWSYERRRVESVVAAAHQQVKTPDDPWRMLADSTTLLMGALDTLLGLRVQRPPDEEAISEATRVAESRRNQLQALLSTMWPMVRGY